MNGEKVKIGQAVKVVDEVGILHDGICTNRWGAEDATQTCINVVFCSADVNKNDSYGRQRESLCSCAHRDAPGSTVGRYWYIEGERKPETLAYYGDKKA